MEECREDGGCEKCELTDRVKDRAYQESLHGKYEVWRGVEV